MAALEQQFNEGLRALQDEFEKERLAVTTVHTRQRKEMQDVAAAMAAGFTEAEGEARQEYESARWVSTVGALVFSCHQIVMY